ncbi:MAG: Fe-S cluster assembly transcriptional regulator IscR [Burkholderiales bacterium]|jgi:Rrf2 family iron-sulfur cluster assembly transcriptional regulator|nr:Fe-S cluster assembly transcriptional regulator IscR [Burkholderiales bacterium]MCA3154276.1 Fe-S cluster assembly transcriptional regulator IscR [Burkholderiales bacterium]MCA3156037.1 Fe-S cluster assembly transcriptional regulator IscR [Burkholderiales bacterium]MCA3158575.1 Fe-S cluster assembly transcriptional regulator IscR [Burkholderiales bacterium]MCA3162148.1 Fe-S cluster assembly transcriptional regulator IscR [Burkholderiales bacterium]
MRLTTKGRFAVTAMIDLALRQDAGPVTLAGISTRQNISLSYLEQLFGKLRRHELVESTRGPGGGYRLGRKAQDISVADIIYAVDEPLDATQCGGKENCGSGSKSEAGRCMTHDLWAALNAKMVDFLDSVTLRDLVDQQRMRAMGQQPVSFLAEHADNLVKEVNSLPAGGATQAPAPKRPLRPLRNSFA